MLDRYIIKFIYRNVRSLWIKFTNFKNFILPFLAYDIVMLTETWLIRNIINCELGFVNLKIFWLNRNSSNRPLLCDDSFLIAVKLSFTATLVNVNFNNI